MNNFRIGFFQFQPLFGRINYNLDQVTRGIATARADVIVLPELPFTGYYFKNRDELKALAQNPDRSPVVDSLKQLCTERQFTIVTGFAEKAADKIFNSALLIGPGKVIHTYRKLHLFNTEKDCFDAGDTPLEVVRVGGLNLGVMICFDWAFPEVCRILALKGADIICHPSNLVLTHCQQAMLTRSLENSVFTVTANRFGIEQRPHGTLEFTGQSQITSPGGELILRAPPDRSQLKIVEIDVDRARDKKITANNDLLRDRRPEFYQDLAKPMRSI